jgi:hypothetical protein
MTDLAIREPSGLEALAALERAGAITPVGLVASKLAGLTIDEYEMLGRALGRAEAGIIWLVGDYLNIGEKVYGDDFYQVADAVGLAPQTLTNRRSICDRVPRSRRRLGLTFSHHAEVAYLEPEEQKRWLKQAEQEQMTVSTLRGSRISLKARPILDPGLEPPRKGTGMAKVKRIVSDLSGEDVADSDLVVVTLVYPNGERVILDAGVREVEDIASKGKKHPRRGRPPRAF